MYLNVTQVPYPLCQNLRTLLLLFFGGCGLNCRADSKFTSFFALFCIFLPQFLRYYITERTVLRVRHYNRVHTVYGLHFTQSKRSLTYVLCSKQQLQKSVGINATKSSNPFRFFAVIQIIYARSSRTCLLKAPNESLSRFPRGIVLILQINTLSLISSKL